MDAWGPQEQYNPMMLENALYDRDKQQSQHQMLQQMLTSNGGGGVLGILAAALGGYMMKKQNKKSESKLEELFQRDFDFRERQRIEDERKASEAAAAKREQDWQDFTRKEGFKAKNSRTTAQKNAEAMGLQPGTPQYNDFIRNNSGPSKTSVNVQAPGQNYVKPFDQELAKADVEMFKGAREQANNANSMLQSVNALEDVLSQTSTGKPQEMYGKLAQYFGAPEGATYQAQQALVNKQVNEILNAAKGPQTEGDAQRAREQIPNMGTDPRARQVVMDFIRKGAQAKIDEFNSMQGYVNEKGNLQGYQPAYGTFKVDSSPIAKDQPKRLRFNPETGELE